jgi:hypothetical protein
MLHAADEGKSRAGDSPDFFVTSVFERHRCSVPFVLAANAMLALRSNSAVLARTIRPQHKTFMMSTLSARSKAYMDAAANGEDAFVALYSRKASLNEI